MTLNEFIKVINDVNFDYTEFYISPIFNDGINDAVFIKTSLIINGILKITYESIKTYELEYMNRDQLISIIRIQQQLLIQDQ